MIMCILDHLPPNQYLVCQNFLFCSCLFVYLAVSLITGETEHHFMFIGSCIILSSFAVCILPIFSICYLSFVLHDLWPILYLLDMNPLLIACITGISSQTVTYLLIFLNKVLKRKKEQSFLFGNNFKFIKSWKNKSSTKNTCIPFIQIHLLFTFYCICFIVC